MSAIPPELAEHAATVARESAGIAASKSIWASSTVTAIVAFFGSNYALVLFSILGVVFGLALNFWLGMKKHRREENEAAQRMKHSEEHMEMEREALRMKREQHAVIMSRENLGGE